MIVNRYRDFVDAGTLMSLHQQLTNKPGWIFRTNFWRYYLVAGLEPYREQDSATWYHNQLALASLEEPWLTLFSRVSQLAGPAFQIMRYALTGQTQNQKQTFHYDVSADREGCYRSYLIYLNPKWHADMGGSTDFMIDDRIVHQEWPEPGKLVEFDSQILHCGQPPDVPNVLRLSMVIHGQIG